MPDDSHANSVVKSLRKREQFIAARAGKRYHSASFILQMCKRAVDREKDDAIRVGYTVTKKTGNSVERNRIKRRLREAVGMVMPKAGKPAHDYVVIAKRSALDKDFEAIIAELGAALRHLLPGRAKAGNQNAK